MITNKALRLNAVVTITQKILFKDIEVNNLSELYFKDFFTSENIESFKENSLQLSSEVLINCLEIADRFPLFIQIGDDFFNLAEAGEIRFDQDRKILKILWSNGVIQTLDQGSIKRAFNFDTIRFLPLNLQALICQILIQSE